MVITDLDSQISCLPQGEHLCSVFENSAEMLAQAVPYIKYGLLNGEQCIYVADEHRIDMVADALSQAGVDVIAAFEHGRLVPWSRREYRQPGKFDLGVMYRFIERTLERSLEKGHAGVRLAVEMTWTLKSLVSPDELVRWEALLNRISFGGSKVSFLCQYNARLLEQDLVARAVCVHPKVVLGSAVCPNIHYMSAEAALTESPSDGRLDCLLEDIRAAVRAPNGSGAATQGPRLDGLLRQRSSGKGQGGGRGVTPPKWHALLEQVVGSMPLGVYLCEAPGGVLSYYNRAAEALWGRTPRLGQENERFSGSFRQYRVDGTPVPHESGLMAEAITKGIVVHDQELIVERPDGSRRTVLINITPVRSAEGHVIGAMNVVQDITERKRSEAARARLVKDLERSKLELHEKIADLQKFEDVVVGREIKMMQLEKEIVELKQRLSQIGESIV